MHFAWIFAVREKLLMRAKLAQSTTVTTPSTRNPSWIVELYVSRVVIHFAFVIASWLISSVESVERVSGMPIFVIFL